MLFVLVWLFIGLQVEDPPHGHVNISDAEQDQSIEHCRQERERKLDHVKSSKQLNVCFVFRSSL